MLILRIDLTCPITGVFEATLKDSCGQATSEPIGECFTQVSSDCSFRVTNSFVSALDTALSSDTRSRPSEQLIAAVALSFDEFLVHLHTLVSLDSIQQLPDIDYVQTRKDFREGNTQLPWQSWSFTEPPIEEKTQ